MGCVQTRPSSNNSPPRGLDKLKLQSGYTPGGGAHRHHASKDTGRVPGRGGSGRREQQDRGSSGRRAVVPTPDFGAEGEGEKGVLIAREAEGAEEKDVSVAEKEEEAKVDKLAGGDGAGNVSRRYQEPLRETKGRGGPGDDMVDGWPRWLTENVPPEVLVGLVPKSADNYDKLAKVGQGTYSNVYKARDRDTGKIVALKKVRFETSVSESVKFMAREIMILQKLDHPNVVRLEGLATSRMQYSLYLVFEFMQTDLSRVVCGSDRRLTEPQVKCYMQQLLAGLQHCHERGILHRDIKGSNLLIDKFGMLKIADFGLANYFNPNQRRPLTSRVVTLWYRAPELLFGATDYGVGIDLWSAGCLLAEMFAGRPLMPGRTEVEQIHRIFQLCGSPSEDYWKRLKLNTSFRPPQPFKPTMAEAFRDFPSSSFRLLTTLLSLDPVYRGSAASALHNEFFSTSPLACDLSGLPVTYKEEDEPPLQTTKKKKKSSKQRTRSKTKDQSFEKQKDDSGSSREKEKSGEANARSQESGSSAGSTSSGVKPTSTQDGSTPPSISPTGPEFLNRSPRSRTECHPWGRKNVKNLPSLTSKPNDATNKGEDDLFFQFAIDRRSNSSTDLRRLEGDKIVNRFYALDD